MNTEEKLEYLSGQIYGLAIHVADAIARTPDTVPYPSDFSRSLQSRADDILASGGVRRSEFSSEFKQGMGDAMMAVNTLLDK